MIYLNVQKTENFTCGFLRVVGIASVEDSLVVVGPGDVGELCFLQNLRIVLAGLDVLEVNVEPIRPRCGQTVSED
jgi:hypothetical protein